MKTVSSAQELQQLAASTGAVARLNGRVINANGEQVPIKVQPMPQQPEVNRPDSIAVMAQTLQQITATSSQSTKEALEMGKMIADALGKVMQERKQGVLEPTTVVVDRPREWSFEFIYDSEGRVVRAVATSTSND